MGSLWGTSEWVPHAEPLVNKGKGGMLGLFCNVKEKVRLEGARDRLSQLRDRLIQNWDKLIQNCISLSFLDSTS
jgi:hypothetical protein